MSKELFMQWLFAMFSRAELERINPVLYLNPDHVEYYMMYKMEDYLGCQFYLLTHRNLLTQP